MIPEIRIEDFSYPLPDARIAKYPLPERDASKLLIYRDGNVRERIFRNLADELPAGSLMVFNDTKVVPAQHNQVRDPSRNRQNTCLLCNRKDLLWQA